MRRDVIHCDVIQSPPPKAPHLPLLCGGLAGQDEFTVFQWSLIWSPQTLPFPKCMSLIMAMICDNMALCRGVTCEKFHFFHSSTYMGSICSKSAANSSWPPSTLPPAIVVGTLFANSWNPSWWETKNCYFPSDKENSHFFNKSLLIFCWKICNTHSWQKNHIELKILLCFSLAQVIT